jgi:hypothetical protein
MRGAIVVTGSSGFGDCILPLTNVTFAWSRKKFASTYPNRNASLQTFRF